MYRRYNKIQNRHGQIVEVPEFTHRTTGGELLDISKWVGFVDGIILDEDCGING